LQVKDRIQEYFRKIGCIQVSCFFSKNNMRKD
jgi:hypothetical protein